MTAHHKNLIFKGAGGRQSLLDVCYDARQQQLPVVIFCHGYKGFKDWGAWDLVAEAFSNAGFFFVKFNFSHNGGTVDEPIDFPDLEAFSENNYSKEVFDLNTILDWLVAPDNPYAPHINRDIIHLIGHSRGGGIVLLQAAEDPRVTTVVTWAGVSDYKIRFPKGDAFTKWKKENVFYSLNGRTKQQMPHAFQFYEDFMANEDRLTISKACAALKIPHLVIHGTQDEAVPNHEAESLAEWSPHSTLHWVADANHVFGAKHPWSETALPVDLTVVVDQTIAFINTAQNP